MIIFFKNGELGNQILQYSGLQNEFRGQTIFLLGFNALSETMSGLSARCLKTTSNTAILYGLFKRLCKLLGRWRLISTATEVKQAARAQLEVRRGLIKDAILVESCFFYDSLIDLRIPAELVIDPKLLRLAENHLLELLETEHERPKVFVHIRRGDYVFFPERDSPAVIPLKWFRENMEQMRSRFDNPVFVVCTDDRPYAEEAFSADKDVYISRGDSNTDFAVMSLCEAGILSASSYSWCAAFFSRRLRENDPDCKYIAPQFWIGHRRKQWYPKDFISDWITYVPVQ